MAMHLLAPPVDSRSPEWNVHGGGMDAQRVWLAPLPRLAPNVLRRDGVRLLAVGSGRRSCDVGTEWKQ